MDIDRDVDSDPPSDDLESSSSSEDEVDLAPAVRNAYQSRCRGRDSVYSRILSELSADRSFAGHIRCFKDVEWVMNMRNELFFTKKRRNLKIRIFGEMASYDQGTRIDARGDCFPEDEPITLQDTIRYRFVFRRPTLATSDVNAAYNDQLRRLQDLMINCEGGRDRLDSAIFHGLIVEPFVKKPVDGSRREYIFIETDPMYKSVYNITLKSIKVVDPSPEIDDPVDNLLSDIEIDSEELDDDDYDSSQSSVEVEPGL
ncbi:hypothetical protein FRB99_002151 [Tulasnella sp. 403]|nr:hypothetical protein FRB99_002151 [Tulasnella sp. 403]